MNLDQHLTYKSHIESIAKKVARATGILWKLRKFLPAKTLLNLYNALIKPHLLYGIGLARIFDWGGPNHKSHAMMSSEIFKKGTFCEAKIS